MTEPDVARYARNVVPVARTPRTRSSSSPGRPSPLDEQTTGALLRGRARRSAENWRARQFDPLTRAADAAGATPHTLRHSFASLLVQAGWNALEISHEMGNSPEVVQRDYSQLFREFARGERLNPEQTIAAARRAEPRRALK